MNEIEFIHEWNLGGLLDRPKGSKENFRPDDYDLLRHHASTTLFHEMCISVVPIRTNLSATHDN